MLFNDIEIEKITKALEPKIRKSLRETRNENRQDLEQDLLELIVKKLKDNSINEVPGFFEVLEKQGVEIQKILLNRE